MKQKCLLAFIALHMAGALQAQSVGIGTNTPNNSAILHLESTSKAFLPPAMSTDQMNAISGATRGMMIFNTTTRQPYVYTQYRKSPIIILSNYRWEPVTTGPRILCWGYVDSTNRNSPYPETGSGPVTIVNGSGNFTVQWDGTSRWYQLTLSGMNFEKDSMLLMITPVGNGSWDEVISVGELLESGVGKASIKFTDMSRKISNWPDPEARHRSQFYFTIYDMRLDPFK